MSARLRQVQTRKKHQAPSGKFPKRDPSPEERSSAVETHTSAQPSQTTARRSESRRSSPSRIGTLDGRWLRPKQNTQRAPAASPVQQPAQGLPSSPITRCPRQTESAPPPSPPASKS